MEGLNRIPCDEDPTCKYYERGCYEDIHHIYSKVGAGCLELVFRELPENKVQTCRAIHEAWERELGWPEYPPAEQMKQDISESQVFLSRTKRRAIYGE